MKNVVGLLLLAASGLAVFGKEEDQPVYGGIPLMTLLENAVRRMVVREVPINEHLGPFVRDPEAEEAVRRTGTNALPYLVELIRQEDVPRADLAMNAFRLLGNTASPAIPSLERIAQNAPTYQIRSRAICALRDIGSNALFALDRLSTNPTMREEAVIVIVELGAKGIAVGPMIEEILKPGDLEAREAVGALRLWEATNALPILTNVLIHPKVGMRKEAVEVMGEFKKAYAPTTVPALTRCLYDSDAEVRNMAANILRRIAPEMFVTNSPSHSATHANDVKSK